MNTCLVYFDETGDDGANTLSSNQFVLTSIYMQTDSWQSNFDKVRACRKELKEHFGLHTSEEIHTKHLVRDKGLYRSYGWTDQQRREIIIGSEDHQCCHRQNTDPERRLLCSGKSPYL